MHRSTLRRPDCAVDLLRIAALSLGILLSACGGGGGNDDGSTSNTPPDNSTPWEQRTAASDPLAALCDAPRSGIDPYTGHMYPDRQGSIEDEKDWLLTYMKEVYRWYKEIPAVNQAAYTPAANGGTVQKTMDAYFKALLTRAVTASGKAKDYYSFTYPTADWKAYSQAGESVDYGMQVTLLERYPPREAVIAYTDPDTPAASAGIGRGARILGIDGVSMVNGSDLDTLNAGLFPSTAGEQHVFTILDLGAAESRNVALTAEKIVSSPVQNVKTFDTATGRVGYLLFNAHIATAEGQLYNAITELSAAGVSDLVLDMRYNGGGYLDIASELAYMVAGGATSEGKVFNRLQFNDHNPLADEPDATVGFHAATLGFDSSIARGATLPQLNLQRVFILTGPGTCSASEAVINGLRGIDVDVVLIGDTTCGKPYGFYATDNCGLSYFAIEFEGVNNKGQGGYADGIAARCAVDDDFEHALGNPAEGRLAAALSYRDTGTCSAIVAKSARTSAQKLIRSPLAESAWRTRLH